MKKKDRQQFRRHLLPVLVILLAACVMVTWQITYNFVSKRMESKYSGMLSGLSEETDVSRLMYSVDTILSGKYAGKADPSALTDATIEGYVKGLGDRYAAYMNAEAYDGYMLTADEPLPDGIGITVSEDKTGDSLRILSVRPGAPAARAGIVPGDEITAVDGEAVWENGYYKSVSTITGGDVGTPVTLQVRKTTGETAECELVRELLGDDSVSYRKLNRDTGAIVIYAFADTTAEEFKKAIGSLTVMGVERFVIDLRNTTGESVSGTAQTLDFLLPEGTLFSVRHKDGTQEAKLSDIAEFDAPIALLVNENTACLAEVFAAALKDFGKAVLIGGTTYGKATYQEIVSLPNGGAVCLSTGDYLPASGASFEGTGLVPDHEVQPTPEQKANWFAMRDAEDAPLQKAIAVLSEMEVKKIN